MLLRWIGLLVALALLAIAQPAQAAPLPPWLPRYDLDMRVDDHPDPLAELERLEAVSRERFVHFIRCLPRREEPTGLLDREAIEARIASARAAEVRR